jgi:hypothetical protein
MQPKQEKEQIETVQYIQKPGASSWLAPESGK